MDDFSARVDREGDAIVVSLRGELDLATAPTLQELLSNLSDLDDQGDQDDLAGPICFDCADLSFVDSSGLAIFARIDRNGGATLRGVRPNVRRVLEVAGLDGLVADA